MVRGVVGVIVTGTGGASLDALGVSADTALTPFAGKFRFLDLALATLRNSGVGGVTVAAGGSATAVRAHLASAYSGAGRRRPLLPWPPANGAHASPLVRALVHCRGLLRTQSPEAMLVLAADHVLQVGLEPLADAHRNGGADLTLATLPAPFVVSAPRPLIAAGDDGRVDGVEGPRGAAMSAPDGALWTGDFVVRAGALPRLLAVAAGASPAADEATLLALLAAHCRVAAFDVLEPRGAGPARGPYWHDPVTLEAYYGAQMDLCTLHPAFDLYDAGWPLPALASGHAPAKMAADAEGRDGRALDTIVADGCVIRGALVLKSVLGRGVVVESGAEVEDSILFDGCRIGARAHVRRALVGPGAVVGDGEEIGYGQTPAGAIRVSSGLTLVPPSPATAVSAGAAR